MNWVVLGTCGKGRKLYPMCAFVCLSRNGDWLGGRWYILLTASFLQQSASGEPNVKDFSPASRSISHAEALPVAEFLLICLS